MKKIVSAILLLCLALCLCACGAGEKSLCDHGMDVVAQIDEILGSDAYLDMYTGDGEIRDILAAVKTPHEEPAAIYAVAMPQNAEEQWMFADTDFSMLSESLKERVLSQAYGSALISQMNARGGALMLAAATVCTGSKTFVCPGAEGSMLYIYVYADACPVAVAFAEGENKAFSATGMLILDGNFDVSSQESIASELAELGAVVSVVKAGGGR